MKKLTAILSVLLAALLLLVGCNNIAADTAMSSSTTPESSLSTSGMQTIIGADSSVKVLNAYESLDYALNKLEGYIEQGIVEEDYMETLKVLSVALKDIETDLNVDNASHIKDLMVTADDTVSSAMGMSDDSAFIFIFSIWRIYNMILFACICRYTPLTHIVCTHPRQFQTV